MNTRSRISVALCVGLWVPVCLGGVAESREAIIALTSQWDGERLPDGRPKVPDAVLRAMEHVSVEEAWGVLRGAGFRNQFEGGWKMIHTDRVIVGRALTARYMPTRPDVADRIQEQGRAEGRIGSSNSWPIDVLEKGDVYVADGFGKVIDGTLIGDNLGNAIFAKSGKGVVFDAGLRDLEGLEQIEGFNAFVRGWDPSAIREMMLIGINAPIRIGRVTVLPGDVVLAKREGVIFIPAYLAERVVWRSQIISLKDEFGHLRLREGVYTPGQIDRGWSDEIKADFLKWLDAHPRELAVPREELLRRL